MDLKADACTPKSLVAFENGDFGFFSMLAYIFHFEVQAIQVRNHIFLLVCRMCLLQWNHNLSETAASLLW